MRAAWLMVPLLALAACGNVDWLNHRPGVQRVESSGTAPRNGPAHAPGHGARAAATTPVAARPPAPAPVRSPPVAAPVAKTAKPQPAIPSPPPVAAVPPAPPVTPALEVRRPTPKRPAPAAVRPTLPPAPAPAAVPTVAPAPPPVVSQSSPAPAAPVPPVSEDGLRILAGSATSVAIGPVDDIDDDEARELAAGHCQGEGRRAVLPRMSGDTFVIYQCAP